MLTVADFRKIGIWLNTVLKPYNYACPKNEGANGKILKTQREYRLNLINKQNDTSKQLITKLEAILKSVSDISNIRFNAISPNSSKFPSYTFTFNEKEFDIIIAKGANKGENFEVTTVTELAAFFSSTNKSSEYLDLISKLNASNSEFANVEITSVKQRTRSTKKEGILIKNLGAIIGDIVLTDSNGNTWYISLKDINGNTFSSYSGAASLFNNSGDLQENSEGAEFLRSFGVDLNLVQSGFDKRNSKKTLRRSLKVNSSDSGKIEKIFNRAWGMNYFYVRKLSNGWKVFWIDQKKLNSLCKNIKVIEIKYPNTSSKQISIKCSAGDNNYLIEIRNSSGGEYPNDIKFKVI